VAAGAALALGPTAVQAAGQALGLATGPATNIARTCATLTGYLNPPAPGTAYYFGYGTTVAYGRQTDVTPAPSGSGLTEVQTTVTGLSPHTTYHFALVLLIGSNSGSVTLNGGDQSFTTSTTAGSCGGATGYSAGGSLRLVDKTLTVKKGKATIPLWCLSSRSCQGKLSITSSSKTCLSGRAFSVPAGQAKTLRPSVRSSCRKLLGRASRHRIGAKLTATLSSGQPRLGTRVTLVRR
jgi:hypothetical protein